MQFVLYIYHYKPKFYATEKKLYEIYLYKMNG